MKYIEELSYGDSFSYQDQLYILTSDFKKDGSKLCIKLDTGLPFWLNSNTIVDITPIYRLDTDNNIVAIKHVDAIKN